MKTVNLIFPNQLFEDSPLLEKDGVFLLIEENLFFRHFKFHVQKLILHRSSMKYYESFLQENNKEVLYIEQEESISDVRELIPYLKKEGYNTINYILTNDNYLERRLTSKAKKNEIELNAFENPMFLNSSLDLESFFRSDKKSFTKPPFILNKGKNSVSY